MSRRSLLDGGHNLNMEDKSCENCEYRDLHGLTKPCTDCQKYEEWQPRVDMHLRAYGGLT